MKRKRILITDAELGKLNRIETLLSKLLFKEETGYTLDDIDLLGTIGRIRNNLKNGGNYFKKLPKTETEWYDAECGKCGWFGSSQYLLGGGQIADTGDYGDVYCPVCGNNDI